MRKAYADLDGVSVIEDAAATDFYGSYGQRWIDTTTLLKLSPNGTAKVGFFLRWRVGVWTLHPEHGQAVFLLPRWRYTLECSKVERYDAISVDGRLVLIEQSWRSNAIQVLTDYPETLASCRETHGASKCEDLDYLSFMFMGQPVYIKR
ncbi:MAG: hypothetical protein AAF170_14560 [Bacteroidota bacterium]